MGFTKLPENFHRFVELFVSFEKKVKDVSTLYNLMYNPKKSRNKNLDQLQKEIDELKGKLKVLEETTVSLGQLFKTNLSFIMNTIQCKETMADEKHLLNIENLNLKHQLKNKQEEINEVSKQLQERAVISLKLSDKLNQLQNRMKFFENKCEDKEMELVLKSSQCSQSAGSNQELKRKMQSISNKLNIEKESLYNENVLLKKRIVELEGLLMGEEVKNTNKEILDEKWFNLSDENDSLRLENDNKRYTIEKLKEEIEDLKRNPQLQIGVLTRENVMLQKLISDQDLKIKQVTSDGQNKVLFKEKAIHDGLIELHSQLKKIKRENILIKEESNKKELENNMKISELEEKLRAKERNMELYEGYVRQARDVMTHLRTITF